MGSGVGMNGGGIRGIWVGNLWRRLNFERFGIRFSGKTVEIEFLKDFEAE
jgi:hypothetical protein